MRVLCAEQYTPEWNAARRGKITASGAQFALAKRGGKGRRLYIEQICNDLEGIPDFADEETPPWFLDGHYYESWARGWYSWTRDVDVREIGFAVHDDYEWIGCSPDGLLDPDGGLEIKYRKFLHTYQKHAAAGNVKPVYPQVQTSMFVCGRKWWDYQNYWRSDDHEVEKGHVQRIERDDAYIENTLLPAFVGLWSEVQDLLEEHRRAYTRRQVR
jgi:hypothetical protein